MKTTERHDLKHNEVADTLQEAYDRIDQNRKAILVTGWHDEPDGRLRTAVKESRQRSRC